MFYRSLDVARISIAIQSMKEVAAKLLYQILESSYWNNNYLVEFNECFYSTDFLLFHLCGDFY